MKKKLILSSTLALLLGIGAFAGLRANKALKEVKADGDPWMLNFALNGAEIATYMDANSMQLHTYTDGVGNDMWFDMYQIEPNSRYFQVNAVFPADYTYNRVQFKFTQGGEDKWGVPYSSSGSAESTFVQVYSTFGSWDDTQWTFSLSTTPNLYVTYNDVRYDLEPDAENARFIAKNVVSENNSTLNFIYRQSWDFLWDVLTTSSKQYTPGSHGNHWTYLAAGTYDIILKNNNSDDGVLDIKKHQSEYVCVYLVGVTEECWVYTFGEGGIEQFGAFPGTQLKDLAAPARNKAHEFTGDLYFEGYYQQVWDLALDYGYPEADHIILTYKNDQGNICNQSADMLLVEGSAYYFSFEANYHNDPAGEALRFLYDAEDIRKDADDESVCNISKSDAEDLVDQYNRLDEEARLLYVDFTTVNTYKRDGSSGKEYVGYNVVMQQLSKIAEKPLVNAMNSIYNQGNSINNNQMIIIIVVISSISVVALGTLLVFKKKRK